MTTGQPISDLSLVSAASIADNDVIPILDVSATSPESPGGDNVAATIATLAERLRPAGDTVLLRAHWNRSYHGTNLPRSGSRIDFTSAQWGTTNPGKLLWFAPGMVRGVDYFLNGATAPDSILDGHGYDIGVVTDAGHLYRLEATLSGPAPTNLTGFTASAANFLRSELSVAIEGRYEGETGWTAGNDYGVVPPVYVIDVSQVRQTEGGTDAQSLARFNSRSTTRHVAVQFYSPVAGALIELLGNYQSFISPTSNTLNLWELSVMLTDLGPAPWFN